MKLFRGDSDSVIDERPDLLEGAEDVADTKSEPSADVAEITPPSKAMRATAIEVVQ
jgi:hypothetical protein